MRKTGLFVLLVLLILVGIAITHDVELGISQTDNLAARGLMNTDERFGVRPNGFEQELALARSVQDRVLDAAPIDREIPEGQRRELSDLIKVGHGLCFDRSRAIETILRLHGMRTRHAAIYSTRNHPTLEALATPGVPSHAVTEVKTSRGWMIVDSNGRWIGLTRAGSPIDLAQLRKDPASAAHASNRVPLPEIYRSPFTWVYGLYSRHGRFYPPYDPVPDVNWKELAENL